MSNTEQIKPQQFLNWLLNRLKFKYKENEIILSQVNSIFDNYKLFPKKIPIELIDSICKKHYPDFEMEKVQEMHIGYTQSERMQIRNLVVDIIKDASNY